MDLRDSDAEATFRAELKAWLADATATLPPPPSPDDWTARRDYDSAWQRRLFEAGYPEFIGRLSTAVAARA